MRDVMIDESMIHTAAESSVRYPRQDAADETATIRHPGTHDKQDNTTMTWNATRLSL